MTIETYNVARIDDVGVEIIQVQPYMTKNDARRVRIRMQRTFPGQKYVVLNMHTYLGGDEATWIGA